MVHRVQGLTLERCNLCHTKYPYDCWTGNVFWVQIRTFQFYSKADSTKYREYFYLTIYHNYKTPYQYNQVHIYTYKPTHSLQKLTLSRRRFITLARSVSLLLENGSQREQVDFPLLEEVSLLQTGSLQCLRKQTFLKQASALLDDLSMMETVGVHTSVPSLRVSDMVAAVFPLTKLKMSKRLS